MADAAQVGEALQEALGGRVVLDPQAMTAYLRDQCLLADAGEPAAVVRATSLEDVATSLRICHEHGVPVVTRGAGTGLTGGANALAGGVVLAVSGMDRILGIDQRTRLAHVQAGVLNGDLDRAARQLGLRYPPDPGSRDISTIGGNVATNAGGMCCAKYGVTRDHVAALTAVMPDGEVIRTGGPSRKNVAGLDLTQLLIGSEGTLAVIVEATLRLLPIADGPSTVVAFFDTAEAAIEAVLSIAAVAQPAAAEVMDATTIAAVDDLTHMGLDRTAGALLLIQCDGPARAAEMAACISACREAGATEVMDTDDAAEGEALMQARRVALTAMEALGPVLLDDVAVPVPQLPRLLAGIAEAAEHHGVTVGTFGHADDGNLHPTILIDPQDQAPARAAFDDIVRVALSLGGTVSGEHGIGQLKRGYLDQQLGGRQRELMAGIKRAFDPRGILNPGRGL